MTKPILLLGGGSEERLVSLRSAKNLIKHYAFNELYDVGTRGQITRVSESEVLGFDPSAGEDFIPLHEPFAPSITEAAALKPAAFFLAIHGTTGIDVAVRRTLERLKIPFTGANHEATLRCGDKIATKILVATKGIQSAPYLKFARKPPAGFENELAAFLERHGKIVLKPTNSGSSLGLHIVSDQVSLKKVIEQTPVFDEFSMMAEKFIAGREITVGVVEADNHLYALPPTEIILEESHIFDFDAKYHGRGVTEVFRPELPNFLVKKAQELAMLAHRTLGCFGYSRTDLILTDTGINFIETNGTPGLTSASFIPKQLEVAGVQLGQFIETQVRVAERRGRLQQQQSLVG